MSPRITLFGGPSSAVTRVTDTFARGTLNAAGGPVLWQPTSLQIIPVTSPVNIGSPFCDGAGNIVLSGYGQNNPLTFYPTWMPCLGFTFSVVNGATQHAQAKFQGTANPTVGGNAGIAVFMTQNGQSSGSCYILMFNNNSQMTVQRCTVSGGVLGIVNLSAANFATAAVGDVLRLSCQAGSPNTLTVLQNGTQIFTTTDATFNSGVPGFCIETIALTAGLNLQIKFSNFDGGVGV